MTTFSDVVYQLGGVPVMAGIPYSKNAKYFFLDAANGSDSNDGLSVEHPFATLAAAYAACTANQHDTIFYIAGSSSVTISTALDWSKNYTHLIGIAAPTEVAQRARFFQLSTLTGASPLLTVSATGCIFKNFYLFQGVDDATSLINVSVTGGRNYFENVHFAGGGHATQAVNGGASLKLDGAEENTFVNCTIGVDTVAAGTGIDRYTVFEDCQFINSNLDNFTMAAGFLIPAFAANNSSRILLKDCIVLGTTKLDANDRGVLYGNMDAVTGADLSGVAVELIT